MKDCRLKTISHWLASRRGVRTNAYASASASRPAQPAQQYNDNDKKKSPGRLVGLCNAGQGNADLLRETLVYTKPEDFKSDLIQVCFSFRVLVP